MHVLVALSAVVHLAIASTCTLGQANDDCKECTLPRLLAERDCPPYGYDCHEAYEVALNFSLSKSPSSGCARLSCADPLARLFVDQSDRKLLRCRSHQWHYGKRDCEQTAHAICARPCTTCKTAVPDCVRNDFQKASITAASALHPCPVASCVGGPEIALFGIRGHEGPDLVVDRIDEGHLICYGGGVWKSAGGGESYDHALCGDATYSCQACEDIPQKTVSKAGLAPSMYAIPGTAGCKSIRCEPGSTLVVTIESSIFETNSVVCGPRGKWLIDGVQHTNVQGQVCVQKCHTCSLGLDGKGLVAPVSPIIGATGPFSCYTATCEKGRLYYLKTRNDTIYMPADIQTLACDPSTQMWKDSGNSELYYQLACQMDACLSCPAPQQPEPGVDMPPGFQFAGQVFEYTGKCKSLQCSADSLLMYPTGSNTMIARNVTCDGSGWWRVDGAIIDEPFACAKSCRECVVTSQESSSDYASPTLFSEPSTGCLRAACLDGILFVKNGFRYLQQVNPDDPSDRIIAACESDGTWSIGSERGFDSIACSKINSICSTACSQHDLDVLTSAPYGYIVTHQELKYSSGLASGLCATITCELPFKLATETHAATGIPLFSSTLTCRGENMWYRDQYEQLKATKAGCVASCDKCSVEFPTLDRNYTKATFRTTTNGCLAPLACPEGNFFYMTSSDSQPDETHDEPRCENGKWSIGEQFVSFVGCKGSCPSFNELLCDKGEPCALDLKRLNDDDHVLVCPDYSSILKSTSKKREAGEYGQYIACSNGGNWWSPLPAKVEYNYFTCAYECVRYCETSTDGGLLSIPATVQIVKQPHLLRGYQTSHCTFATCAPDQAMFGINEDKVPHAIGREATCIAYGSGVYKWLAKTGGKFLRVFCVDT